MRKGLAIPVPCAAVLIILCSCLTGCRSRPDLTDLVGTWINSEYDRTGENEAKMTVDADGKELVYYKIADKEPAHTGRIAVTESWHDFRGNAWLKVVCTFDDIGIKLYGLTRLGNHGREWEGCYSQVRFPSKLTPIEGEHEIHFRQ
jgi:hypothetical protein